MTRRLGRALSALPANRARLYRALEEEIGNTPLVRYEGAVANGNRIMIKRECDNTFGSHYDRVYLWLFAFHEALGHIRARSKVVETTSGSAGVSFAAIGKELGFDCIVALPEGGEKARERAILEHGAELILTPEESYIAGLPRFIKRFLVRNRDVFFLNHSCGPNDTNNEIALAALGGIVREIPDDLSLDVFCPAIGNGSSALGPGRELPKACNVIGFEAFSSAVAYDLVSDGTLENDFGVVATDFGRHRLPGTSYAGVKFPHIRSAVKEGILSRVVLVSDRNIDAEYFDLTRRRVSEDLPHWDDPSCCFADTGRTTRAGLAVVKELARSMEDKTFLIIAYDKSDRYDGV